MYDDRDVSALTAELAQQIAIDIGRITGFNVLITDQQAVVIGCGDPDCATGPTGPPCARR
jgi:hypothetical protein